MQKTIILFLKIYLFFSLIQCSTAHSVDEDYSKAIKYTVPKSRLEWIKHVENRKEEIINHFIPLLNRYYLSVNENYWLEQKNIKVRLNNLWNEYGSREFDFQTSSSPKEIFIVPENDQFKYESLISETKSIPYAKNYYHIIRYSYPVIDLMDMNGNQIKFLRVLNGNQIKLEKFTGVVVHILFTIEDDLSIKIIDLPTMECITPRAYIAMLELKKIPTKKIDKLKEQWNIY